MIAFTVAMSVKYYDLSSESAHLTMTAMRCIMLVNAGKASWLGGGPRIVFMLEEVPSDPRAAIGTPAQGKVSVDARAPANTLSAFSCKSALHFGGVLQSFVAGIGGITALTKTSAQTEAYFPFLQLSTSVDMASPKPLTLSSSPLATEAITRVRHRVPISSGV